MKNYNSKTITLKLDSVCEYSVASDTMKYSSSLTKLRAEALTSLLISANPLREEYNLSKEDYDFIAEQRAKIDEIINNVERHLNNNQNKI